MRDSRKGKDYFNAYLDYQYSRIQKKTAKLKECDASKKQRVLLSLVGYETDLLKAEFSVGASNDTLKTLLTSAIDIAKEYDNITYDDLLLLVSLSVSLGVENDAKKLVKKNSLIIEKDRLLKYLATYIENGKAVWDVNVSLSKEYKLLDEVFSSADKEKALLKYLDNWYINHSEYAWYDSHKKDTDTYCGYWSFETPAIMKIAGITSDVVNKSEFMPIF